MTALGIRGLPQPLASQTPEEPITFPRSSQSGLGAFSLPHPPGQVGVLGHQAPTTPQVATLVVTQKGFSMHQHKGHLPEVMTALGIGSLSPRLPASQTSEGLDPTSSEAPSLGLGQYPTWGGSLA